MKKFAALLAMVAATEAAAKPNIVFFLTDDQDQMLGGSFPIHNGVTPMPKTKTEMSDKGTTATNWFIHTPICCPSRAELVTGRYFHNIKKTAGCPNGHAHAGCCMHVDESLVNNYTLASSLKYDGGYTVGIFGKYLNNCPPKAPPGFDAYFANGGGTYFSPSFAVENVDGFKDGMWQGSAENYTTSVVGNVSHAWIRKVANGDKPFMAYIAPKAAHEPFLPAPWYADHWEPEWPETEPRPVSWNSSFESRADHHHAISSVPMITTAAATDITRIFMDRWRTLMSVDDLIHDTISLCTELGVMSNTYFFYSSDHGFQLGQFNLPMDKRHMYEFDIRIHLLVRGPGIKANSEFNTLGSQVDLAATWLGMAGIAKPSTMDGKSIVPFIIDGNDPDVPESTKNHIKSLPSDYAANWRDSMFIEYYYNDFNTKCIPNCYNIEDPSNNYIGIRHLDGEFGNTMYGEFQTTATGETVFDNVDFVEYYNVSNDPWQMDNLYNFTKQGTLDGLHQKLRMWYHCAGDSCP